MSAFLKPFATLVSPTFYRAQWAGMIKSLNAEFVSGSISPLYKVIALVGFTGYVSRNKTALLQFYNGLFSLWGCRLRVP